MSAIALRVKELPQCLQDMIGSYNVDHRQIMKQVCDELRYWYEQVQCFNCGVYYPLRQQENYTLVMAGKTYNTCSDVCYYHLEDRYDMTLYDNRDRF